MYCEDKLITLLIYSYLATGDSYTGLKAWFCMGKSTIHKIIKQTCDALWSVLKDEVMPKPTEETWKQIE